MVAGAARAGEGSADEAPPVGSKRWRRNFAPARPNPSQGRVAPWGAVLTEEDQVEGLRSAVPVAFVQAPSAQRWQRGSWQKPGRHLRESRSRTPSLSARSRPKTRRQVAPTRTTS